MKYILVTSDKAMSDIEVGANYYNGQQKGLGTRFASVIKSTLVNIRKMPLAASIAFDDTRYKVVEKFPYIILYVVRGNMVFITRVFNTHQQPVY